MFLQTAALLFSEYICLAIMSFPWCVILKIQSMIGCSRVHRSFSVLGVGPGIIVTVAVAMTVQYTSLILWRFCLKHPDIRDVCDIGRMLFGGSQIAYNITAVFFILNNTFIQGKFPVCPPYQNAEAIPNISSTALSCRRKTVEHSDKRDGGMHSCMEHRHCRDLLLRQSSPSFEPTQCSRHVQCCDDGYCCPTRHYLCRNSGPSVRIHSRPGASGHTPTCFWNNLRCRNVSILEYHVYIRWTDYPAFGRSSHARLVLECAHGTYSSLQR